MSLPRMPDFGAEAVLSPLFNGRYLHLVPLQNLLASFPRTFDTYPRMMLRSCNKLPEILVEFEDVYQTFSSLGSGILMLYKPSRVEFISHEDKEETRVLVE